MRQSFFQKNHMKISKIESWKRQHSHWWKGFRKIIFKKCKLKIPKDCQKHLEQRFYIAIHLQWGKSKMFSQFMFQTVELLLSPLLFLSKLNKILMFVSITAAVFRGHHYFILCFFRENIKNYDSFNEFLSKND